MNPRSRTVISRPAPGFRRASTTAAICWNITAAGVRSRSAGQPDRKLGPAPHGTTQRLEAMKDTPQRLREWMGRIPYSLRHAGRARFRPTAVRRSCRSPSNVFVASRTMISWIRSPALPANLLRSLVTTRSADSMNRSKCAASSPTPVSSSTGLIFLRPTRSAAVGSHARNARSINGTTSKWTATLDANTAAEPV